MVELITGLREEVVRANLQRVRRDIDAALQRSPRRLPGDSGQVEILAATKYVPLDELPTLARAGVRLVGENRAQDLQQ